MNNYFLPSIKARNYSCCEDVASDVGWEEQGKSPRKGKIVIEIYVISKGPIISINF